jgi:hypothetical protein
MEIIRIKVIQRVFNQRLLNRRIKRICQPSLRNIDRIFTTIPTTEMRGCQLKGRIDNQMLMDSIVGDIHRYIHGLRYV